MLDTKKLIAGIFVSLQLLSSALFADVGSAVEVTQYISGSSVGSFTNPNAVLGLPSANVSASGGNYSPFNPHFATSELSRIGVGGSITLRLSNYVLVVPGTLGLGVFENVGLIDSSYPNGVAGATAASFGDNNSTVEVSADGVSFISLGTINFTLFGNYWLDSSGAFSTTGGTAIADFGKPYIGSISDFAGKNYSQIKTQLDGSAGGTWIDLNPSGLAQVGWVRFSNPGQASGTDTTLELNAVTINSAVLGATTVPEPGTWLFLAAGCGFFAFAVFGRKSRHGVVAVLALLAFTPRSEAMVTSLSDIQYWVGSGSNQAALAIDWNDGIASETFVWGFRWNGTATGKDMFNAVVDADPGLVAVFEFGGDFVYGIGYDANQNGGTFTFTPSGTETGSASDPGDHFHEGLSVKGFWGYYLRESSSSPWLESQVGFGDSSTLADGKWNGFSWSTDLVNYTSVEPGIGVAAPIPVPEPGTWIFLGMAGVFCLKQRIFRKS